MRLFDATYYSGKPKLPEAFIPLPNVNEDYITTTGYFDTSKLNQCRRHADGAVIWGGWDTSGPLGRLTWDDNAPWWLITKQYL